MRFSRTILLVICAGVIVAGTVTLAMSRYFNAQQINLAQPYRRSADEMRRLTIYDAAREREQRIISELVALPASEWAGEYSTMEDSRMRIAPASGVVFFESTDVIGTGYTNHGDIVAVHPDRLVIQWAADPAAREQPQVDNEMIRVRAFGLRYLVPKTRMREFLAKVMCSSQAWTIPPRREGLRRESDSRIVLPKEFHELVLDRRIAVRVTETLEVRTEKKQGMTYQRIDFAIDKGRNDGLWVGLRLQFAEGNVFKTAAVTSVEPDSATAEVMYWGRLQEDEHLPVVGEELWTGRDGTVVESIAPRDEAPPREP